MATGRMTAWKEKKRDRVRVETDSPPLRNVPICSPIIGRKDGIEEATVVDQ